MTEPVLPGARGPRPRAAEQGGDEASLKPEAGPALRQDASAPAPLFGNTRKGVALPVEHIAPAAVLAAADYLPPELERQLAQRADGPRLAASLQSLFPVAPGREDLFGAEALQAARDLQERAAALTAEISRRDLHGRLGRLADELMAQAAPGWLERTRRALGGAPVHLDAARAENEIAALRRELHIVLPPTERLAEQAVPALAGLNLARNALQLAQPWLDEPACARRLRLLEATQAGCNLVPAQVRQLREQLGEVTDRLHTLESATLPALRNAEATMGLSRR